MKLRLVKRELIDVIRGSLAERFGGPDLQSEVPRSSLALTSSQVCSRYSRTPFYHVSSDTSLMRTLVYDGKFCLSQRKRRSYIFSKINLLNTDTRLIRTLLHEPSVSVLTSSFQYSAEFNSLNRLVTQPTGSSSTSWDSNHVVSLKLFDYLLIICENPHKGRR